MNVSIIRNVPLSSHTFEHQIPCHGLVLSEVHFYFRGIDHVHAMDVLMQCVQCGQAVMCDNEQCAKIGISEKLVCAVEGRIAWPRLRSWR
jgi:hypothetical protein